VVDDGSDDVDLVSEIVNQKIKEDSRVRYISLEKNTGKWNALNRAIATTDAVYCTSHDADDVSLRQRLELQAITLQKTNTIHNLCGFEHCWSEDDVNKHLYNQFDISSFPCIDADNCSQLVTSGFSTPGINHYYTGNFETAGVSALFLKQIWDIGVRFNPPGKGLRVLISEDSDFNFRVTTLVGRTSICAEKPYLYRRHTSTNTEEF